jgi:hypothetical protein
LRFQQAKLACIFSVIASEAKQSTSQRRQIKDGLLRCARNDDGGYLRHTFAISPRVRASFDQPVCPERSEGAGNAGRSMRPQPRMQN